MFTGYDLQAECRVADPIVCRTYILGIVHGVMAGLSLRHQRFADIGVCFTEETTSGDINAVVIGYMEANPKVLSRVATTVVLVALIEAFPCPVA
ncbi:MAG: Rap1a/Tai family immunity protein [Bauldia sp.]